MKKLLLLVPIVVIIVVIVTKTTKDNEIIYTTSLDEPTTVSFWYVADEALNEYITEKTDVFNDENEMIDVELKCFATIEEYEATLQEATEKPNMVLAFNYQLNDLYKDDAVLDLSPYFNNLLIDLNESTYLKTFLEDVSFDDEIIALPFFKYIDVIYVNEDLYQSSNQEKILFQSPSIGIEKQNNLLTDIISNCGFTNWVDVDGNVAFNDTCVIDNLALWQKAYTNDKLILDASVEGFINGDFTTYISSSLNYDYISDNLDNMSLYPVPGAINGTYGSNIAILKSTDYNNNLASLTYMLYLTNSINQINQFETLDSIPTTSTAYESELFINSNDLADIYISQQSTFKNAIPKLNGAYYVYQIMFPDFLDSLFLRNEDPNIILEVFVKEVQSTLEKYN